MIVRRRQKAREDIDEIAEYIGQQNRTTALDFFLAIEKTLSLLGTFPGAGTLIRRRRHPRVDLRRIAVKQFDLYVVYYAVTNEVEIVRVLHAARDRDSILRDEP